MINMKYFQVKRLKEISSTSIKAALKPLLSASECQKIMRLPKVEAMKPIATTLLHHGAVTLKPKAKLYNIRSEDVKTNYM